jgi:gliding motility-associated-like protein
VLLLIDKIASSIMMKRYLLSIILGFLTMTNISFGQVEIIFANETANANGTVDIDVTTNGFTNISGLQFSVGWDSLVMTFNSITFTNPNLPELEQGSFGIPEGSENVDEGQFSLVYFTSGSGNLPNGAVLFTARFDLVGAECDETAITMTNDPTPISAFDSNFNNVSVTSQPGSVMINGQDCNGGGGDELTFTAATVTADVGTNICVPITVMNFIDIQTGTGTILWDPTVISYTGLANIALSGLGGSLNETNTANGELKFIWSNPDPANPVSLPDGDAIFEICFDVVGDVGDMSPITLSTQGNLGFEWGNDDVNELPLILQNGKVTVTETVGDPFTLNVSDITVNEGATNVCVDISVENFTDILAMQFVIVWDASILSNATPSNFNLDGLNSNSFNIVGNCATMSWNVNFGIDLADDTEIFSMCFDVIGPCDSSSEVDIVSKGNTNIQIVDGNTNEISNVSINAGSVSVECTVDCSVVSVDKTCIGAQGGNVIVDVPTDNCTFSWANSAGAEVATTKNLLGVAAGTYILTVTCDGAEVCTLEATVENITALGIEGTEANAGCGELGSIDVTVSLGSGNYSYNWNPAQTNSPNISELEPGTYELTVTDEDTGCTQTAEFVVVDEVANLVISSSNIIDETCLQNDGRISLTIMGGCQPYSFVWSDSAIGNTPNAMNLADGTYQVTVTDGSVPANTVTGSFTVDGTDPLMMNGAPVITPSTGSDGSINITIMGGTPDYSYNWSGPTTGLPNSNNITGLMQGMYSVTVTDSKGCQATFGPFNVPFVNPNATDVVLGDVQAVENENGFALLCNGDTNGEITGTIEDGKEPFTVVLSGDESRTFEVANLGTFTIDGLAEGTYTVSVSNTFNTVSVENIIISAPEALASDVDKGCDSEGQCDGFIDVNVSGGFGALSYDWGNPNLSGGSLNDLCQGTYAVLVTDENGCQLMESIVIESCEGPIDPACYEVRDVITPNGDGMNDQFAVTCISDFPASLEIYDRWGKLVFNQDSYDGTWSGISNSNEALIEGGYMYIITIDFGQGRREIMKGTVTLLRD